MLVFATHNARHLLKNMQLPQGEYFHKQFADGEHWVKIKSFVADQSVWVVTGTQSPADNFLELLFLLDALTHASAASINLFITYFGYARQTEVQAGQAHAAQRISEILKQFPLSAIKVMHMHAQERMHSFLSFETIIDNDFFCSLAYDFDVIAAPDQGAFDFAKEIAERSHKKFIALHKTRITDEQVTIEPLQDNNVRGKKILLVDDIIATGMTISQAGRVLMDAGALSVSAAATHGIFCANAHARLAESCLKSIFVTNTIEQTSFDSIQVHNSAPFIEKVIKASC